MLEGPETLRFLFRGLTNHFFPRHTPPMPDLPQASAASAKVIRTNHIFVDFENIHEIDLALVAGKPAIVYLILGEKHQKLAVEIAEQFLKVPQQIRLIKAGKSGNNALDFVLAYHVGVESVADPKGYFHIVSRDTGFDALIVHLKTLHVFARRDESFAKAFEASERPPIPTNSADLVKEVIARLTKNENSRPKRKKTLLSQINAYFQKRLTEAELEKIVQKLTTNKVIEIGTKNEVVYKI